MSLLLRPTAIREIHLDLDLNNFHVSVASANLVTWRHEVLPTAALPEPPVRTERNRDLRQVVSAILPKSTRCRGTDGRARPVRRSHDDLAVVTSLWAGGLSAPAWRSKAEISTWRLRVMQGPRTTATAWAVIQGIEAAQMIRKGQVLGITRHNLHGQAWVFGALLFKR